MPTLRDLVSRCDLGLAAGLLANEASGRDDTSRLSRDDYHDRVRAVWSAQIAATIMAWPFEHKVAWVTWLDRLKLEKDSIPVDDNWYYEMVAVRGFRSTESA